MKWISSCVCLILLLSIPLYASSRKQAERLLESEYVIEEIMKIPEDSIPKDLFRKAECIVIIPSMKKAALGVGGEYGRGCIVCRLKGTWSPPVMVSLTGGSFGFQLGGTSTDIILLVMNKRGIDKLLQSKFTIGVDASAAAGPKGRTAAAATDAQMRAEILCYARSRGLFAGVSINGSVLKPDRDDNEDLYGHTINSKKLLLEGGPIPAAATNLVNLLAKY